MNNQPDLESQAITGQASLEEQKTILQQSSHPVALVFHFLFKVTALVLYFVGGILNNSVLLFVLLVLLIAFDFWTVKNITGRLLVGLRYWNDIKEDGTNVWIFESKENRTSNAVDRRLFWTSMYVTPAIWGILAFMKILSFYTLDFLICVVAMSCSIANVIGYSRCEKDAKQKLQSYIQGNGMVQGMVGSMITSKLGSMFAGKQ